MLHRCRQMQRHAQLVYTAREKAPGVAHHAKAGNINSALVNTPHASGDFVLVLDCDMIVHPEFLLRTLGHFYVESKAGNDGASAKGQPSTSWVLKPKAALLQAPQDFWNVEAADPLGHCARFFYGPGLQGRDGANATPCCGTGVLFRRDILVSIGGQAYGSVTEDYNTAMHLLASGFGNMYVNERLTFGMVPEDISGGWLAVLQASWSCRPRGPGIRVQAHPLHDSACSMPSNASRPYKATSMHDNGPSLPRNTTQRNHAAAHMLPPAEALCTPLHCHTRASFDSLHPPARRYPGPAPALGHGRPSDPVPQQPAGHAGPHLHAAPAVLGVCCLQLAGHPHRLHGIPARSVSSGHPGSLRH
jgi:hypothetical protein